MGIRRRGDQTHKYWRKGVCWNMLFVRIVRKFDVKYLILSQKLGIKKKGFKTYKFLKFPSP